MKIQVDWYYITGKWKYGGEVEIGDAKLWRGDLIQAIIDNQKIICKGWQRTTEYIVVTQDTHENGIDPNYHEFYQALYFARDYSHLENTK